MIARNEAEAILERRFGRKLPENRATSVTLKVSDLVNMMTHAVEVGLNANTTDRRTKEALDILKGAMMRKRK